MNSTDLSSFGFINGLSSSHRFTSQMCGEDFLIIDEEATSRLPVQRDPSSKLLHGFFKHGLIGWDSDRDIRIGMLSLEGTGFLFFRIGRGGGGVMLVLL